MLKRVSILNSTYKNKQIAKSLSYASLVQEYSSFVLSLVNSNYTVNTIAKNTACMQILIAEMQVRQAKAENVWHVAIDNVI